MRDEESMAEGHTSGQNGIQRRTLASKRARNMRDGRPSNRVELTQASQCSSCGLLVRNTTFKNSCSHYKQSRTGPLGSRGRRLRRDPYLPVGTPVSQQRSSRSAVFYVIQHTLQRDILSFESLYTAVLGQWAEGV